MGIAGQHWPKWDRFKGDRIEWIQHLYLADALTASTSTDDSIEHIFFQIPSAGQYKLVVHNNFVGGIGDSQSYGLAWWFGSGSSTAAGDFNGDGNVDAADYVVWRKDPANHGGAQGYADWRANFGNMSGTGSFAAVPEPSSAALLSFGFISLGGCFVRRRLDSQSRR